MAKVNQQTMKTQYDGQYDTFCRKNHDYGNSFEESLDQFGIVASIVRMSDKMNRLVSLTDESKTQQVGSESLLDTLEDLSNYAAMTACWLKGVQKDDEVSGTDTDDIIRYNIQDVGNILKRSAEMEKEFNKHIPSKVENIDPRNYVLNMLSNIFRVVQMKIDKDEILVPMDISDEAGLIAKAIVESQTEEEGGAVINNYMCIRKDIPYELKDWIYGIIAHYSYYLKKERTEYGENTIYADNKPVVIYEEDTSKYEADVTIGNDWELTDAVRDVVTMLKVVFKLHCKIEEFRMTKEDYEELDHITNRLRSMVDDGTISEELMRKLIDIHVKLNKDSLIYQLFKQPEDTVKHILKDFNPDGVSDVHDLWPKSMLKLALNFETPPSHIGFKIPRCNRKSRRVLSAITGVNCFDLEPGHIPEIQTKEEYKNIYDELEELFVKQNEHIKVLLISGAGKDDIKPLAILDYKSKTSEAVNGYDLMVALDCLIPNLSKEGLEHFIDVANNVLKMKDFDHE